MINKGKILQLTLSVLLMGVCFTSSLIGQEKKIAFEKYGIEEGLPEEAVSGIVQDNQGFMWFTTQNGLVKFNGYKLKVFRATENKKDSTNLQLRNLNGGMIKGNDGKIWIGGVLNNGGIASFDPVTEKFRNYIHNPKDSTSIPFENNRIIFKDTSDNIWFTSFSFDIDTLVTARLNVKTHKVHSYPYKMGARRYNEFLLNGDILDSNADNKVWLRDDIGNVRVFNQDTEKFELVILSGSEIPGSGIKDTIRDIVKGRKNHFLMMSEQSVIIWDPVKKESTHTYTNIVEKDNMLSSNSVNYAFEDLHGNYWVVHNGGMLTIIDPVNNRSTKLTTGKGLLDFKNAEDDIQLFFLLHQDLMGIWFQTFSRTGSSFVYYQFSTKSFTYYDGKFNDDDNLLSTRANPYSSLKDRTGLLWLGTRPNFYKQSPKTRRMELFRHDKDDNNTIPSDTIYHLVEDTKNRLWIGTQSGISIKLKDNNFKQFYYKDADGKLIDLGDINRIYEDSKGNILVASNNHGLLHFNESKQEFSPIKKMKKFSSVANIQEDVNGNIWVSVLDNGVYILNIETKKIIKTFEPEFKDDHGLLSNRITSMFLDSRGNVWLGDGGDNTYGLFKYNEKDNKFRHYIRDDADSTALNSNEIRKIIEDDLHRMWVATDGGVNLYDHEEDVFNKHKETFDISSVRTITKATKGRIWAATYASGGLALLGPGINNIEMYGENKGLLHNDAANLILDDYGNLWVPTERGLSVLDTLTKTYTSYFEKDGYQKYTRRNSIVKTSDGDIWIGGINGLNRINPKQIFNKDTIPPQVIITSIGILDSIYSKPDGKFFTKAVSYTDKVHLKHWQKDLSFEFVGLHYLRSEDNAYSWKLENYDTNWSTPSKERQAAYTNLSPGTYTFKVKASNADGIWNEEGASIKVIIASPWWFTWWAYLFYALVVLLLGLRVHKSQKARTLRLEREKSQLKELEQAKEIEKAYTSLKETQSQLIQSEKMASLGELTAGIAHEIQNPLNFVNNFSEVSNELVDEMNEELDKGDYKEAKAISKDIKQNLEKINHHGKRADAIVKGMLQHSRNNSGEKENVDLNKLSDEFLRLAYHGLRAKDKSFNATLETDFDPNLGEIEVVSQEIGRVILNLFTNAFYAVNEKQSSSSSTDYKPTVSVVTKRLKNSITIAIKDNGNGIPKNVVDKIFEPFFTTKPAGKGTGLGLSMSYDIIKSHNGQLDVSTKTGEYTEFKITLPLKTKKIMKILVVDDEHDVQILFQQRFRKEIRNGALNFLFAFSGEEALETLRQMDHEAVLILSDINMPGMSGLQLLEIIKKDFVAPPPVVMMVTAYGDEENFNTAKRLGADDFLTKPVDFKLLKEKLIQQI